MAEQPPNSITTIAGAVAILVGLFTALLKWSGIWKASRKAHEEQSVGLEETRTRGLAGILDRYERRDAELESRIVALAEERDSLRVELTVQAGRHRMEMAGLQSQFDGQVERIKKEQKDKT